MAIGDRAEFQTSYLFRYALMAAVGISFSLWFLYDGLIGYPRQIPAAEAYDALRDLETGERLERWAELAAENGWPEHPPEKTAAEIRSDIVGQYVFAALFAALGFPALYLLITSRGSWIEETEEGLRTSWGVEVPFSKVQRLDKRRWAKKGIARIVYDGPDGPRSFLLDDFKYDREVIGRILRRLESELPRDKIVGGPTEAEMDALEQKQSAEQIAAGPSSGAAETHRQEQLPPDDGGQNENSTMLGESDRRTPDS